MPVARTRRSDTPSPRAEDDRAASSAARRAGARNGKTTPASTGGAGPPAPPPSTAASRHGTRTAIWLTLALCLAAVVPPMAVEFHRPAVFDADEAKALRLSLQTWNHHVAQEPPADDPEAPSLLVRALNRLMPYRDGQPRLEGAPALTWLHELALLPMGRELITTPQRIHTAVVRCRIVTMVMTLILVAAVYWAGHSIGGLTNACFAALVCAASVGLLYHARLATGTVPFCAFAMLAMASAIWAIRPLRPRGSVPRRVVGWTVCGLTLGAAVLTAGPAAGPLVTIPLLLIVLLCPHRVTNLIGVVTVHALAALTLIPWAAYVHSENPEVWSLWLADLLPADATLSGWLDLTRQRGVIMLVALAPWVIWLLGGLMQPFSASSAGSRQRQFLGWGWFVVTAAILLALPQTTSADDGAAASPHAGLWAHLNGPLMLIVPVAAVLIGEVFSQYVEMAAQGRFPRLWRVLRWPHLLVLLAVSLVAGGWFYLQPPIVASGWIEAGAMLNPGWLFWIGLGAVLVAMTLLSMRWSLKEYPAKAIVCWALWMIVLFSVVMIPITRGTLMARSSLEPIEVIPAPPAAE